MKKTVILIILIVGFFVAFHLYSRKPDDRIAVDIMGPIPDNPKPGTEVNIPIRILNEGPDDISASAETRLKYSLYGAGHKLNGTFSQAGGLKRGKSIEFTILRAIVDAGENICTAEELTISNGWGRNIMVHLIRPAVYKFYVTPSQQENPSPVPYTALPGLRVALPAPESTTKINAKIDKEILRDKKDFIAKIHLTNTWQEFMRIIMNGYLSEWDTDSVYVKVMGKPGQRNARSKQITLNPGESYDDNIDLFITDDAPYGPIGFRIKFVQAPPAVTEPITVLYLPTNSTNTTMKDFFTYFNKCIDSNFLKIKEGMTIEEVRALAGGKQYAPSSKSDIILRELLVPSIVAPNIVTPPPFSFYIDSQSDYKVGLPDAPKGLNDFFVSDQSVMQVKYFDNGRVKENSIWPKEKIRVIDDYAGTTSDAKVQ